MLKDAEITILNVDDHIRALKREAREKGKPLDMIVWEENGWKCLMAFVKQHFTLPDGTKYFTYMGVDHTLKKHA